MLKIKTFILNLFNKNKNLGLPQDRYETIINEIIKSGFIRSFENEATNKIQIGVIRKEYGKGLKKEKNIGDYPLETKLTREQTIELTKDFFEHINHNFANNVKDSIEGRNSIVILKMPNYDGTQYASVSNPNNPIVTVTVPVKGDLRDLYGMTHELTHTLDIENGDTVARKVLGEVAPQCMERMLDEYLLNLPQESLMKYGIDEGILIQDIQNRKVTTFLSRVDNAIEFNRKATDDKKIDLRYALAQIYQARFMKYDSDTRKSKIVDFIRSIENDDLDKANSTFDFNMSNSLQRQFYIGDSIQEIVEIVNPKGIEADTQSIEDTKNIKTEEEKDINK